MKLVRNPAARPLPADERARRTAAPAFGTVLTEHMVSARHDTTHGWHDARLEPYAPLSLDPATVGLHYGQVVFEGLKAFRTEDGSLAVFRPEDHARRLRESARRLMVPELPEELFLESVDALVAQDQAWLPDDPDMSLYLRPVVFASEATLALRPAHEYRYLLLACVTEGYFGRAQRPVRVWVTEEFSRAAPGGTGAAKCAGNYAAGLLAQETARAHGCDQVVWLDAAEHRWVEEMGGMNLFFVFGTGDDARLVTPPLGGTILPGVTRDSILRLAPELGLPVAEAPVSLEEWRKGCEAGEITEVFACGTAARVSPVNEVCTAETSWTVGEGTMGAVTARLSRELFAIQRGAVPDRRGWLRAVPGTVPAPAGAV
ncbi:branched-chain amino acid aminotransferase [Streptomyces curacoi]|uniref:Branched-chain-amino-acid aminotransferase n=1 Tax=Streptomyces curacoi TaxID=146536 RepID=A0A117PJ04_9ACTN|nr:branched-chain amino acid aminotransferase [Streptomyces curacoi]KUM80509.1 branched chain amino acid aminotransferase [Streptomyces curacoi]